MSFFDLISYDYMPKGSYCVTANGVVFSEEVSEEMKNRFLKDLEKNRRLERWQKSKYFTEESLKCLLDRK